MISLPALKNIDCREARVSAGKEMGGRFRNEGCEWCSDFDQTYMDLGLPSPGGRFFISNREGISFFKVSSAM